jgi:hypothetical protein
MAQPERPDADRSDGRNETVDERSDRNWTDIVQELRVTQTGTQIISGFLLAVAFQQRFGHLRGYEIVIYAVLVCLASLSTVSGLAVVSLHRARFRHHDKPEIVSIASRLLESNVWVVALLATGVVLFIFDFVFGLTAGVAVACVALVVLFALMVLLPAGVRRRHDRRS